MHRVTHGFKQKDFHKMMQIEISDGFIKLGQAMKLAGLVSEGAQAKLEIQSGNVFVNQEQETRRGRKLYPGDTFTWKGREIQVKERQ